ncbi:hypothetical protein [Rhodalgimonas zhirmunskyi]|nr:hypothetical protein [Rhodoalgimonas zhirmunskyi]
MLRSVPPVSSGRLLMPMVFLSAWNLLHFAEAGERMAFVWAAVLAQSLQLWAVMPHSPVQMKRSFGRARITYLAVLALMLMAIAVQVWMADPLFSQRLLSALCIVYALVMLLGLAGERDVLDSFAPDDGQMPMAARRHMLRLFAFVAFVILTVNEGLILFAVPLAGRVAVLALLPILLNFAFLHMLRLTRSHLAPIDLVESDKDALGETA